MKDGPDISRVAALIGDTTRSTILLALMDGRALTATELAALAGVTKQTVSSHLARLLDGGLLAREVQGRHHYFRIADEDVSDAIEALLGIAERNIGKRTRTGPRDVAMRKARVCYDHLAGDMGVFAFDKMHKHGWLETAGDELTVSKAGWDALSAIDVEQAKLPKSRRPVCKTCLDWSVRRHHLAGRVGEAMLDSLLAKGWVKRLPESRVLEFSKAGESAFKNWLAG